MTPEAIVFDVDGVLFDTESIMYHVWEEMGRKFGRPQIVTHYLEFVGQNRADNLSRLQRLYGPDFPGLDFLLQCSDRCHERLETEGVPFKPGVRELLEDLRERNIPMALATSTNSVRTARRMEMTGLGPYFQTIVTGDMVSHSKPDPEIYRIACEQLGVAPAHALAVEDSPNGIYSAHGAGMQVVMIPDLIPCRAELQPMLLACLPSLAALGEFLFP